MSHPFNRGPAARAPTEAEIARMDAQDHRREDDALERVVDHGDLQEPEGQDPAPLGQ